VTAVIDALEAQWLTCIYGGIAGTAHDREKARQRSCGQKGLFEMSDGARHLHCESNLYRLPAVGGQHGRSKAEAGLRRELLVRFVLRTGKR
jgi:hypothetical protein